jgi:hypothetical protein
VDIPVAILTVVESGPMFDESSKRGKYGIFGEESWRRQGKIDCRLKSLKLHGRVERRWDPSLRSG